MVPVSELVKTIVLVSPEQIVAGDGVAVTIGFWFTVIVIFWLPPGQPPTVVVKV